MKIETITSVEAEARADALGKTYAPGSEEEFAAFEEKYLGAYDLIFEAIGQVASLDDEGGELSMSDGVDPERMINVVVMQRPALRPALLEAIRGILNRLDDEYEDAKFAVQLRTYSLRTKTEMTVYVFPGDEVCIKEGSDEDDLAALGLR